MIDFAPKVFLGLIAVCFTSLTIQLIPISRQASSWNRCFEKTSSSLSQVQAFNQIDSHSREVLSVMICNGAVFDSKIRTNSQ